MDKITIEVENLTKVSDGYHTIEELYEHRNLLIINFALEVKDKYPVYFKYSPATPGWFILYIKLPTGQISYHVSEKYLDYTKNIPDAPRGYWDNHTSEDVQHRLNEHALNSSIESVITKTDKK